MDQLLNGLYFTFFTVDNILIFSNTVEDHIQHLKIVFNILKAHGLVLDVDSCMLGVDRVNSFGQKCSVEDSAQSLKQLISDKPVVLNNKHFAINNNFLINSN